MIPSPGARSRRARAIATSAGGPGEADDPKVWSIVCFFVKCDLRGHGIGPKLVEAAIETARKHGAKVVEADRKAHV